MNPSPKIQIALSTLLLWSSTAVVSFAATPINSGEAQSVAIKVSAESLTPSPLNRTPDAQLMAGPFRDNLMGQPGADKLLSDADEIWKNPADRSQKLLDYCNTPPDNIEASICLSFLMDWAIDQLTSGQLSEADSEEMSALMEAIAEKIGG